MADKLINIFNKLTGKTSTDKPETAALQEAKKIVDDFNTEADKINETLRLAKASFQSLSYDIEKMTINGEDAIKIQTAKNILEEKANLIEQQASQAKNINIERDKKVYELAKKYGQDPKNFKTAVDAFDELSDTIGLGSEKYSAQKDILSKVAGALSLNTNNLVVFSTVTSALSAIWADAANQAVRLNTEMIKFQRNMSGALNATALGFNNYGNNVTAGRTGSIDAVAGTNNLQIEELMSTFQAFSDGQVIGLNNNLQQSQEELLKYGVSVGKVSKLYGVQQSVLNNFTKSLTQDYGVKIGEVTNIIKHGAEVASAAGVNVGHFFENMQQIANLTGALFIRGGAAGMEKAALTLSKLGLSASSLERVASSITDFGTLVEKQNKAASLGLTSYSRATSRIFAKSMTGDSGGALLLQQTSLAKDISARYMDATTGAINQQGIMALQAAGIQKEEITGIQRLIKAQKQMGLSFEQIADETNLTVEQLAQKRNIEQENMGMLEKVGVLWATIKSSFVDPIAAVLGPFMDILLDSFIIVFKVLGAILKPVIRGFEILGQGITYISKMFNYASNYITAFFDRIGLGSAGGGAMSKLIDALGYITAVLIGLKAFQIARWAWDQMVFAYQKGSGFLKTLAGFGKGRVNNIVSAGKGPLLNSLTGINVGKTVVGTSLKGAAASIVSGSKNLIVGSKNLIVDSAKGAGNIIVGAKNIVTSGVKGMTTATASLISGTKNVFTSGVKGVVGATSTIASSAKNIVTSGVKGMTTATTAFAGTKALPSELPAMKGIVSTGTTGIKNSVNSGLSGMKNIVSTGITGVKNILNIGVKGLTGKNIITQPGMLSAGGKLPGMLSVGGKIQQGLGPTIAPSLDKLEKIGPGIEKSLVKGSGGLMKSLGGGLKGLVKGIGPGLLVGLGGSLIGGAISGDEQTEGKDRSDKKRLGDTVSTTAEYAGLGAMIGSIVPGIGTAIGGAIGGVVGAVSSNWDIISEKLSGIWDSIVEMAQPIIDVIKPIFQGVGYALGQIWEGIKSFVSIAADVIGPVLSGIWEVTKGVFSVIWKVVEAVWDVVKWLNPLYLIFKAVESIQKHIGAAKDVVDGGANMLGGLLTLNGAQMKKGWAQMTGQLKSIDENTDPQKDAKINIASQTGGIGPSAVEQLAVIRTKGASSMETTKAQEERMNKTFGGNSPQKQTIVIQQRDLLGGYKVKATGG